MTDSNFLTVSLNPKEINRIFSKILIDPDDPLGKCWEWTGHTNNWGYGETGFRGKTSERVHRITYAWLVAPVPKGCSRDIPVLDHIVCDNPKCCNPFHLQLVTHEKNILRGNCPPAINARKTHCKNGHLLPETFNTNRRERACMICRKAHTDTDEYRIYMRDRMRVAARKKKEEKQAHLTNPLSR